MVRGTGPLGRRPKRLLRVFVPVPVALVRALVVVFIVAAGVGGTTGCDGGEGWSGDAGDARDGGRVDPTALAAMRSALLAGRAQEVIAVLASAPEPAPPSDRLDNAARIALLERGLERDKGRLLGRLDALPITTVRHYAHLPALHLRVESEAALQALATAPEIAHLEPERTFTTSAVTVSNNLALIRQPAAASAGKIGSGTTVVVMDTGTDYKRAPFGCSSPGGSCKVVFAADLAPDDQSPDDARAHGTNVSGTILAVAPGTKIAALDVFDGNTALTSTILAAINWSLENQSKYNIVALNMSFGGGAFANACTTDALAVAIALARTRGILSIVASGNEGKSSAIASPACSSKAISVGAVYDTSVGKLTTAVCADATTAADQVACFSNSAPFLNLLAPGVAITAAGLTMSGTSQAAPHVAGAVAVLRAAFPNESLESTVDRLLRHGTTVRDTRNGYSQPRLNLEASLAGGNTAIAAPPAAPPPPPPPAPKPGPSGSLQLNNGARYTRSATISVSAATTSGTATQMCLATTTTCSTWRPYVASAIVNLPGGDGSKTVRAWWKDAAGNVSAKPATATIGFDSTAPTGGKLSVAVKSGTATYSWVGVKDVGSGIVSYQLVSRTDGPVPERCTAGQTLWSGASKTVTQKLTPGKLYYVRLCAIDAMGNVSTGIAGQFETPPP